MDECKKERCKIKEIRKKVENWEGWKDDRPNSCGGLIITGGIIYLFVFVCVFVFARLRTDASQDILSAIRDGIFATTITFALPIIAENTMAIKRFILTMFQFSSLILFILFGIVACLETKAIFGMIFLIVATAALIALVLVIRYTIDRNERNSPSA